MPTKKKTAPKTTATITCTCDRLPLPTGEVLVRDQTAEVPIADAKAYAAQDRASHG